MDDEKANASVNTDRHLWSSGDGSEDPAYSVFVTEGDSIGIACYGHVIVKTPSAWHEADKALSPIPHAGGSEELVAKLQEMADGPGYYEREKRVFREAASRISTLEEQAHYATGTADLAMQHRDAAEARVSTLEARVGELVEALTPSAKTKGAYSGEFRFTIQLYNEDGDQYPLEVPVPWTTIKEIMKAIHARALAGKP